MTERVALCIETGSEADVEELAELAVQLRRRLLELDIERVDPATVGPAPPGTCAEFDGDVLGLNGTTRQDQHELIQSWIDRYTPTGDVADERHERRAAGRLL